MRWQNQGCMMPYAWLTTLQLFYRQQDAHQKSEKSRYYRYTGNTG